MRDLPVSTPLPITEHERDALRVMRDGMLKRDRSGNGHSFKGDTIRPRTIIRLEERGFCKLVPDCPPCGAVVITDRGIDALRTS